MPSGNKAISEFQNGSPPQATDDYVFERANVTYRVPFSAIQAAIVAAIPATGASATIIVPGMDGNDGEDGQTIPGKDGTAGIQGVTGSSGRDGIVILPDDPMEPDQIVIPGPQGVAGPAGVGTTGATGVSGITMFHEEIVESDLIYIPGPKGDTGTAGTNAASSGPIIWIPEDPPYPEDQIPPEYPSDKNVVYLGRVTGTGVTVGPLIWFDVFEWIKFKYQIGGYSGGTPVGRVLMGSAAIAPTGLTTGNVLVEGATVNNTSVNVPGTPLAVTLSSIARSGWGTIRGESGAQKQIDIHGMSGNPNSGTAPLSLEARAFFNDLGTNLPIKRLQLTVYDTLITAAVSANQFTATTYIEAWGIRKNG